MAKRLTITALKPRFDVRAVEDGAEVANVSRFELVIDPAASPENFQTFRMERLKFTDGQLYTADCRYTIKRMRLEIEYEEAK